MDKIKAFFANATTRTVCIILFCVSGIGMIIGGITVDDLQPIVIGLGTIVTFATGAIAIISGLIHKK